MTQSPDPLHPGKILYEQAMQPLGVSRNKLARDIDVPVGRISDIVAGKRGVTPDTALRLGKYFGTSAEMWMQFQTDHDLHVARRTAWRDIAPRVRELEPLEPGAVVPVTAMDMYGPEPEDADWTSETPDEPVADHASPIEAGSSEDQAPAIGSEEKWWSAPLSEAAGDPPHDEIGPAIGTADPAPVSAQARDAAGAPEPPADDAAVDSVTTGQPRPQQTITLDDAPGDDAPGDDALGDDAAATEQTFEIDVRPAAAASNVVATDVVREAMQALEPSADGPGEPADPGPTAPEPIDDDALMIELDEDDGGGELPGDAFASELDEDAVAHETAEAVEQEYYVSAIARTGTDDFGPPDPSFAAPGLDTAASAAAIEPAALATGSGAPTDIRDLTPANWSSALESARLDEPGPTDPETLGPESGEATAAPPISDRFDVPPPSELDLEIDGPVPPWPPHKIDDSATSLDIPDPEEARKLYEYDD